MGWVVDGRVLRMIAKDPISLLYVGRQTGDHLAESFSLARGFSTRFAHTPDLAVQAVSRGVPDIILIDDPDIRDMDEPFLEQAQAWINRFVSIDLARRPALFLAMDQWPDTVCREQLFQLGMDRIICRPLSSREIVLLAGVYLEKRDLEQTLAARERALKKAFSYLDTFKSELKQVKGELVREKSNLNNALKQILNMTGERRHLQHHLSRVKENLAQNMDGFFNLLVTLITTRVEANRGHGERVSHIALFIARQFDFDEKKLEDVRKAAMLHEVGLLFMPEALEREEESDLSAYEKMRQVQYPVKGADLLCQCQGFEGCAAVIRFLNEHADGTGFPDRLKRRYIPLASRILAGADELDRLRDDPGITSRKQLLRALEELAGSRLDPVIVSWLEKYVVLHMGHGDYRVKGVGVEALEPGMRLGTALFTFTGTKLFSADTLLTREAIDKIIQYHRAYPVNETVYVKA